MDCVEDYCVIILIGVNSVYLDFLNLFIMVFCGFIVQSCICWMDGVGLECMFLNSFSVIDKSGYYGFGEYVILWWIFDSNNFILCVMRVKVVFSEQDFIFICELGMMVEIFNGVCVGEV